MFDGTVAVDNDSVMFALPVLVSEDGQDVTVLLG
jgi:hypothetical protein